MNLLEWYNLIFEIPLALGLLAIIGLVLGIEMPHGIDLDGDGHVDIGHDAGHDAEHDTETSSWSIVSLLGFGKVPFGLTIMVMLLTYGGTGICCNFFLAPLLKFTSFFVLPSIAAALFVMVVLTGSIARLVNRVMPTLETTNTTSYDLIGSTGDLILPADTTQGLVLIKRQGDVYQVDCRSETPLPKGASVLVTSYEEGTKVYWVCKDPLTN